MSTIDPNRQKLLDRLAKLLALSQGTSFAGEAATARAMAAELMNKHNLSLGEGSKDRNKLEVYHRVPWAKGAQWEFFIANAVAKLCGCKAYHYNFQEFRIAGTVGDLEALRYILDAVHQQRIAAWMDYKLKHAGADNNWSFSYSFARALEDKIDQLIPAAAVAATAKAKLWFESTHNVGHNADWITGRGQSAAGRDAGAGTSLHRGTVGHSPRLITDRRNR